MDRRYSTMGPLLTGLLFFSAAALPFIWTAAADVTTPSSAISSRDVRVTSDEKTQTLTVTIQGHEILVIDQNGARVNGDLVYTGQLKATGGERHAK